MSATSHAAIRKSLRKIVGIRPDFDMDLAVNLLVWAVQTNKKRGVSHKELFSDPFVLIKALVDLVGADAETIYAAIIYPAIRSELGTHLNPAYFDEIATFFKDKDGIVSEKYMAVKNLAINTLQIRALDLLPPPASLVSIQSAFDLPQGKEAKNLGAYFILSKQIAEDERAWNIRAVQWHLKLMHMREEPTRYSEKERMLAYYYTDKFYSPFCEYLALQKLKEDKSYSPVAEEKGLYRLKMAMDEELVRQIYPEDYEQIQKQMQEFVRSFEVGRKRPKGLENAKLGDLVTHHIKELFSGFFHDLAIPMDFVRIESRWKSVRSIIQKQLAGRTDIHDYFGIRFIVDVNGMETAGFESAVLGERRLIEASTSLFGRLHAAIAKKYDAVPGRLRNTYVDAVANGFRSLQNTFKIFGQDVEIQFVDLNSHINNCIGTASHFIHRIFVRKKADGQRDNTVPTDLLRAFNDASNCVVVRTVKDLSRPEDGDLFVLKRLATIKTLVKKIHTKLLARAASAIVTDRNPINILDNVRVLDLETPLRSGQIVHIVKNPTDKLAA